MLTEDDAIAMMIHRSAFKAVSRAFKPYVAAYLAVIVLILSATALSLLTPYLFKIFIDKGLTQGNYHAMCSSLIALGCATVCGLLIQIALDAIHEYVGAHFTRRLREHLFRTLLYIPIDTRLSYTRGDLYSRLMSDSGEVYGIIVSIFIGALGESAMLCGVTICMLRISLRISLYLLLAGIPIMVVIGVTSNGLTHRNLDLKAAKAILSEFILERLGAMDLVRSFLRQQHELRGFDTKSRDVIRATFRSVRLRFGSGFGINATVGLAVVGSLYAGGCMVLGGRLTVGGLIALYMYAGKLFAPVQSLSHRTLGFYSRCASLQRIGELLALESCPAVGVAATLQPKTGPPPSISCSGLSFQYDESVTPVFSDFGFDVLPGTKLALIGPSGSGKTTLLKMLAGYLHPTNGSIVIDGLDATAMTFEEHYTLVGFIGQEVELLNLSIADNIRYGCLNATDEEVDYVVERARLSDLVSSLPQGLDTRVGVGGCRLSRGQRQRLAIARLLLTPSNIWLLDEFTSSLDETTESEVLDALEECWQDKTVIIVSHRPSILTRVSHVLQIGSTAQIATRCSSALLQNVHVAACGRS